MDRPRWPHQIFALQEIKRLENEGCQSFCVTSPTGGGKSTIISDALSHFVSEGHQCAVFTGRRLLTNQLSDGLNRAGIHLGVRAADFESWTDPNAPVQVCSIQTEISRVLNRRERAEQRAMAKREAKEQFKLFPATRLIIDEAHQNTGERKMTILREYEEEYGATRVGVTATPLGISKIYEKLVIAGITSELRACGALVPAYCYEPASFDVWKIRKKKTGVYTQAQMEERVKAIWSQCVVGQIFDNWKKINPDARPSLGMAPGVAESLGLAVEFTNRGINAAHIDGEGIFVDGVYKNTTEYDDRKEVFERSKSGDIKIIWNRFVLREAIDLPWLEYLSLATPIASLTAYLQVVGRVLRSSRETGKTHAHIIDHGGSIRVHGSPNLDRDQDWLKYYDEDADKITRDRISQLRDPKGEQEAITCPECGMMRKTGPKCPGCGHEHTKSVRKVIQEDGELKRTEADMMPKRRERSEANTVTKWRDIYFAAKNGRRGMTFNQAMGLFVKTNHYWPPRDLPYMPKESTGWDRKVRDVKWDDLIHPVADPNKRGAVVDPQQKMDFE